MTAVNGTLRLEFIDDNGVNRTVDAKAVLSFEDSITATAVNVPIVTYTAENAFCYDAGATEVISVSIKRAHPVNYDDTSSDSLVWSNQLWKDVLVKAINRWQARTDGCTATFTPVDYENSDVGQQLKFSRNVYVQSLSFTSTKGDPSILNVSLTMKVGSIRCDTTPRHTSSLDVKDMLITMTDSDFNNEYIIYKTYDTTDGVSSPQFNCVTEYTITGGMEQPFECLTMTISKKRLTAIAPYLVDDIRPGHNIIKVHAMGTGTFIVTKCSTSNKNYKITAYAQAEQYRGLAIGKSFTFGGAGASIGANGTPFDIIHELLINSANSNIDNSYDLKYDDDHIRYCIKSDYNHWGNNTEYESGSWCMTFSEASTYWYVLSVCALRLHAKIWFSEGYAYLIDPSLTSLDGCKTNMSSAPFDELATLYLNKDGCYPVSPTSEQTAFMNAVVGTPSLGDEGSDALKNYVAIAFNSELRPSSMKASEYASSNATASKILQASIDFHNYKLATHEMTQLCYEDAAAIAYNLADMCCDTEQSITFKLSEIHAISDSSLNVWKPYFKPLTHATSIVDYSNDLHISNASNFTVTEDGITSYVKLPAKLCLSTYKRCFPEGYTEYSFGIISQTDFTQNSSTILTALNG